MRQIKNKSDLNVLLPVLLTSIFYRQGYIIHFPEEIQMGYRMYNEAWICVPVLANFEVLTCTPLVLLGVTQKTSHGVKSGLLAGHSHMSDRSPRRPNQHPANIWPNLSRTVIAKWVGTSSYMKTRSSMASHRNIVGLKASDGSDQNSWCHCHLLKSSHTTRLLWGGFATLKPSFQDRDHVVTSSGSCDGWHNHQYGTRPQDSTRYSQHLWPIFMPTYHQFSIFHS